jgi:hypothetical protein
MAPTRCLIRRRIIRIKKKKKRREPDESAEPRWWKVEGGRWKVEAAHALCGCDVRMF